MIWQWLESTPGMIVSWGLIGLVIVICLLTLFGACQVSGRCSEMEERDAEAR